MDGSATVGRGPAPDAEPDADLAHRVRRGLGWSLLNNFVGRAGTVLAGIVLARILAPYDYGLYAVALVALAAVLSVNELGVSLAVVRWPGDVGRIAPTVMTIALAGSGLLYLGMFLAAPAAAAALSAPEATGVLRLLVLGVLVDGATAVPAALLTREFAQGRRTAIDLSGFALGTAVTITLALAGWGAWSLAWGRLAGNLGAGLLFLALAPRRVRPGFDRAVAGELLRFGLPLAGASLLVFAMLNVDYVVVGALLGPVALGFYLLAFNLSSWPVSFFSEAVRRVALAGFSRLEADPERQRQALARAAGLLAAATLPVCALLGVLALPLVRVVYGGRWAASAAALGFLALLGASRVLLELGYDFLVARGRSAATLRLQAAWTLLLVPALLLGARAGGIRGVAVAHAVVALAVVVPLYLAALARAGVTVRAVARQVAWPAAAALVAAGAAALGARLGRGDVAALLLGGGLGAAAYLGALWPGRRRLGLSRAALRAAR